MKFHQQSLAHLLTAASNDEKAAIKKLMKQFFMQHDTLVLFGNFQLRRFKKKYLKWLQQAKL